MGSSLRRIGGTSVLSTAYGGHNHFAVTLPQGDDDPEHREVRYPVIYLLSGDGQSSGTFIEISALITKVKVVMLNPH